MGSGNETWCHLEGGLGLDLYLFPRHDVDEEVKHVVLCDRHGDVRSLRKRKGRNPNKKNCIHFTVYMYTY